MAETSGKKEEDGTQTNAISFRGTRKNIARCSGLGRCGARHAGAKIQRCMDGMLCVRPVITATLSADHRVSAGHHFVGSRSFVAGARKAMTPEKLTEDELPITVLRLLGDIAPDADLTRLERSLNIRDQEELPSQCHRIGTVSILFTPVYSNPARGRNNMNVPSNIAGEMYDRLERIERLAKEVEAIPHFGPEVWTMREGDQKCQPICDDAGGVEQIARGYLGTEDGNIFNGLSGPCGRVG